MGRRDANGKRLRWPRGKKRFARDMRAVFGSWSFQQLTDWAREQGASPGENVALTAQPDVHNPINNSAAQYSTSRIDQSFSGP